MRYTVAALSLGFSLLLTACGGSPPPTATLAPSATALPPTLPATEAALVPTPVALDTLITQYGDIPTSTTLDGFARLGFPNAPVSVTLYAAFNDEASVAFAAESLPSLVQRARAGEILLTFVPLAGGDEANGRGAARAAACAAQQDAFWPYQAALYNRRLAGGANAFEGAAVVGLADELAARGLLDRVVWEGCMASEQPDAALAQGESAVLASDFFTAPPYLTVNDLPSLSDAESLDFTINLALQQFNESLAGALEATPESTDVLVVTLEPLMGDSTPPPLLIGLPEGWQAGYDQLVVNDVDGIRSIPFALYTGPVSGGTGSIVVLWGFPNMASGNLDLPVLSTDLFLDGLRLLRLTIVEPTCNIGTDLRRNYSIGGLAGTGTAFSAVDCGELPDTRGWFAGISQYGLNYMFFAYTEPIEAMDTAEGELQSILDTVRFIEVVLPETTEMP